MSELIALLLLGFVLFLFVIIICLILSMLPIGVSCLVVVVI